MMLAISPQTPNNKILSPAVDLEEESQLNHDSPTFFTTQNFFVDPRISHSISSSNDLSTNRPTTLNNSTNKRKSKPTKKRKEPPLTRNTYPRALKGKKTRHSEDSTKKIEDYFSKIDEHELDEQQEVQSESSSNEDSNVVQLDSDEEEIEPRRPRKYSNESLGTEEEITQEYRDLFLTSSNESESSNESNYVPSEANESEDNDI
jgi:hypothetical protein